MTFDDLRYVAAAMTARNLVMGLVKKLLYVKRI